MISPERGKKKSITLIYAYHKHLICGAKLFDTRHVVQPNWESSDQWKI